MSIEPTAAPAASMDAIVALCKRRGFIFQSSEIYGGYNGFFDYGPLGVEVKKNIKDAWWRDMVQRRDDVVGLDSSIIMSPKIWVASGHVGGFSDPMVDCKVSKARYRADQLYFAPVIVRTQPQLTDAPIGKIERDGVVTEMATGFMKFDPGIRTIGYVSVLEDVGMQAEAEEKARALMRKHGVQGELGPLKPYTEATPEEYDHIPSPATGDLKALTAPRDFNLMFETKVGALSDSSAVAYLRPETAQGIFANYKNVVDTGRVKIPFGIAQIGKAFRNEITPRNFIFRSREFEQMEIEYFIAPDADWEKCHRDWIDACLSWLASVGLPAEMLGEDVHPKEKLAFYSRATTDITFAFPFGTQELWGIAARSDYDLQQHQKHSGKSMEFFDEATKAKYVPHVIEPSLGVDRLFLAILSAAYCEDEVDGEPRSVLKFHPRIAPYKVAVLPLLKNKPELVERARALYEKLQRKYSVFWDVSGAIGRRYRRQDEAGTPWCVTIDFETIEKDGTFTLRDRDTTQQRRVTEAELLAMLDEQLY